MLITSVLDTTVASLLLDKRPAIALYRRHLENQYLCVSFQTLAEMRHGALKANCGTKRREELEKFLDTLDIIPSSDALA